MPPDKLRLLLVEDSEEDEFLLLRELRKAGLGVSHRRVDTPEGLREALSRECWDLVISDYNMPAFSAVEALEIYKQLEQDIPFVIVSGTVGEETAVAAMRAGAHDFLIKGRYSRLVPVISRELREFEVREARRRAEKAVAQSERRFRALIDNALDIITVVNADGTIQYVSPSLERVLGYRPDDSVQAAFLDFIHPEDRDQVQTVLSAAVASPGQAYTAMFRHQHRDGSWRVIEAFGQGIEQASLEGVVVNSRDVTERFRVEEALRQANARLHEALEELKTTQHQVVRQERLRALGEMASGIVHDFNNALSSVLGFSETLLMYPDLLDDREQTTELIKMINTAAQDAAVIVSRLGEFYRHRERQETLQPVDLREVAAKTISLTQPRWKGQARAAGVLVTVEQQLEPVPPIMGNEQELRQALTNLVFNAVDAMPEGGRLRLCARPCDTGVLLELSDSGIGMPEEVRQRCLEPFFTTKGQKGTGMGLAMVYGIIRRHQATMDILSQLGEGTTFRMIFPLRPSASAEPDKTAPRSAAQLARRCLRVMVVEEDSMLRKLVSTYLSGDGHTVETAACGQEAIARLSATGSLSPHLDLVITCSVLPDMSGQQLATSVKQAVPDKPVILLTGFGADGEDHALAGVDVVVKKPFTLQTLRNALGKVSPT